MVRLLQGNTLLVPQMGQERPFCGNHSGAVSCPLGGGGGLGVKDNTQTLLGGEKPVRDRELVMASERLP